MGAQPEIATSAAGAADFPEIAAQAIVRAARQGPRELWVGWPAVKSILSARIMPGLGDRIAASGAYEAQEADEPTMGSHPDNLFATVDGSQGAHGRFDARAKDSSLQLFAARHRVGLVAIAALVVLVLAAYEVF
jgi:hypothetical protein